MATKTIIYAQFKELRIWQQGMDIAVKTYQLAATFPKEDRYGICQQMTRAGVSIPSNIAEGSSRTSEKTMPVLLNCRWDRPLNWKRNY
jgi:hypothetical protein